MKKVFNRIKENPLWAGIGYNEFESVANCMQASIRVYDKVSIILLSGNRVDNIGFIVSGSAKVIKEDANGNIAMLTELSVSDMFGEVFACAGVDHSPVTVQASEKCEIMFFNYKKVVTSCSSSCLFHSRLIENMLKIIALRNLLLSQKIEILSKRTTREKLLAFFDAHRNIANRFTVPYNREEMAQYLCVNRSTMSYELSRMRDEGLIRYNKNEFELL